MQYVVNPHGHYFRLEEDVALELERLEGCMYTTDENELTAHLQKDQGLDAEEVMGSIFHVQCWGEGLVWACDRGFIHEVSGEIEDFLLEYEV